MLCSFSLLKASLFGFFFYPLHINNSLLLDFPLGVLCLITLSASITNLHCIVLFTYLSGQEYCPEENFWYFYIVWLLEEIRLTCQRPPSVPRSTCSHLGRNKVISLIQRQPNGRNSETPISPSPKFYIPKDWNLNFFTICLWGETIPSGS